MPVKVTVPLTLLWSEGAEMATVGGGTGVFAFHTMTLTPYSGPVCVPLTARARMEWAPSATPVVSQEALQEVVPVDAAQAAAPSFTSTFVVPAGDVPVMLTVPFT
ncbi:MAG TPA: hypothetical protein VI893_06305, partial [Thermoplasmata archaeon]|nr:hypothetical protein [Thermoplasmata archaeon]